MTINLVGFSPAKVVDSSSNTTIVGTLPAGGANGNLMVAHLGSYSSANPGSVTVPAGWNPIENNFSANGTFTLHQAFAWTIRAADTNLTFTITAAVPDDQLVITEWSGDFNASTPVTLSQFGTSNSAVSHTAPSLTTVTANSVLLSACGARNGSASGGAVYPSGMTPIYNERTRAASNACRTAMAYQVIATPGATGTKAWTNFTDASYYGVAASLVINHTDVVPPAITSVNGGTDTARIGQSVSVAVSNFTDPVNAGTIDTVPLAAASSTSITLPAFAPGALVPRVGASRALVLTRGEQSATRNITVQAPYVHDVLVEGNPVAYEYVTAEAGFNTGANDSIVFGFDPPMAVGDQIFYDPTKGSVTAAMQYVGDYIGEQVMWHYEPDTRIIRQFTVITSVGGRGIIARVITAATISASTITARTI